MKLPCPLNENGKYFHDEEDIKLLEHDDYIRSIIKRKDNMIKGRNKLLEEVSLPTTKSHPKMVKVEIQGILSGLVWGSAIAFFALHNIWWAVIVTVIIVSLILGMDLGIYFSKEE